jgi:hypothetical protein
MPRTGIAVFALCGDRADERLRKGAGKKKRFRRKTLGNE